MLLLDTPTRNGARQRRSGSLVLLPLGLACYAALVAYSLLSAYLGPAGFVAYRRLEAQTLEMEKNLGTLGKINEALASELVSLSSDADRSLREARELGFIEKGETQVLLPGKAGRYVERNTGLLMPFTRPASLPDEVIKKISLGVFLAVLALFLAPRGSGSRRKDV